MTNRGTHLYLCWVSVVLTIVFALPSCGQDNTAPSAPVVSDPADMLPIEIEDLKVHSRILGQDVAYSIILPYDYYSSSKNYPVVYMLHGIGGDHTSWMEYGNVARVMANMPVEEAIIVSPDGYDSYYSNTYDGKLRYESFFLEELIPTVDKGFRTFANREGRSIMGFSMGGFGALTLALKHTDTFSAVAALSASIRTDEQYMTEGPQKEWDWQWGRIFGGVGKTGKDRLTAYYRQCNPTDILSKIDTSQLRGLRMMIDIGDKETKLAVSNNELHEVLVNRHIDHEWQVRPGGHDFMCWNAALPKALCLFLGKTLENKAMNFSKGEKTVRLPNALLYMPKANRRSIRRYPVLYVTEDSNGEFSNRLYKIVDSLAQNLAIRPIIICQLYKYKDIKNAIRLVESKCDEIRTGKRFCRILSATILHEDIKRKLITIDKDMHY